MLILLSSLYYDSVLNSCLRSSYINEIYYMSISETKKVLVVMVLNKYFIQFIVKFQLSIINNTYKDV